MPSSPTQYVTVFTDASHCPHTLATGWAVWIKHGTPATTIRFRGTASGLHNSTEAELHALERAIKHLLETDLALDRVVVIQSDSQGALAQLGSHHNKLGTELRRTATYVKLKHVKGHQGLKCPRSAVNTWCDREARKQMNTLRTTLRTILQQKEPNA